MIAIIIKIFMQHKIPYFIELDHKIVVKFAYYENQQKVLQ